MLQIYLIGVVIAAILYCCDIYLCWKDGESITLNNIIGFVIMSILSWLTVIFYVIRYIASGGSDIIVIKGKRNKH